MWDWALAIISTVVVVILWRQYAATRRYRPLASRQPPRRKAEVPLGLEAIDAETLGQVNRRNEALERGQLNWLSKGGFFGRPDTDVPPLADDETYAARYHAAFHKSAKDTDK